MFLLDQRTKMTVIKISDANLAARIVMFILLEIVSKLLACLYSAPDGRFS